MGMIVQIGADVSQAVTGLKQVDAALDQVAQAFEGVELPASRFQEKLKSIPSALVASKQAIVSLIPPISKLGDSIETLRAKVLLKQQQLIEEKDIAKVAILNKEIDSLIAEISRIGNAGKVGFDALGQAILVPVGAIGKLEAHLRSFKSGLATATSTESIARLNRAIQETQNRLLLLRRAGTTGFDVFGNAIIKPITQIDRLATQLRKGALEFSVMGKAGQLAGSNLGSLTGVLTTTTSNISPLVQQAKNLGVSFGSVVGGAGAAFSALRQIAFILPGIGIAGLIGGLSDLVIGLFKSSAAFSSSELAAAKFADSIKQAKEGLQEFIGFLDFTSDIDKLKAKLANLGDPSKGDILGLQIDKEKNKKVIDDLIGINDRLTSEISHIRSNAQLFLSKSGQQLLDSFADTDIPDDLINKLKSSDKKTINELKAFGTQIKDNREAISKASKENDAIDVNLQIKAAEETKRILDKRKSDWDKFVSETISKGKKLTEFFKDVRVVPQFSVFDTKQDEFKKAISFLDELKFGEVKIKFDHVEAPDLRDQIVSDVRNKIKQAKEDLTSILNQKIELPNVKFRLLADAEIVLKTTQQAQEFQQLLKDRLNSSLGFTPEIQGLTNIQKKIVEAQDKTIAWAQTVSGTLTPAFQDLFGAILSGEDGLKSFFKSLENSVKQLISKLVAAAVAATVVSLLIPGSKGGLGFAKLFARFAGFEKGGRPPMGKQSLGGEIGRELWIPDVIKSKEINKQTILGNKISIIGSNGPQLFKPTVPGIIIPNNKIGQAMSSIKNYFSNNKSFSNKSVNSFSSPLTKIFSNTIMKRESGGPVFSGVPFLGGEIGREIFFPTSNKILPTNNLSSIQGSASQNIKLGGEVIIDGQKLRVVLARVDRFNNRNV